MKNNLFHLHDFKKLRNRDYILQYISKNDKYYEYRDYLVGKVFKYDNGRFFLSDFVDIIDNLIPDFGFIFHDVMLSNAD